MSSFHPDHSDSENLLNCQDVFQVVDNNFFSISNMTDKELRQSIVQDILCITIWEKEFNRKIHFGFTKFLQWIPRSLHKRVYKQMKHDEIVELIEINKTKNNTELRIKNNNVILQAAMDYCGVWYDGFSIPADRKVFTVNRKDTKKIAEITETIMTDILAIAMGKKANAPTSILTH